MNIPQFVKAFVMMKVVHVMIDFAFILSSLFNHYLRKAVFLLFK